MSIERRFGPDGIAYVPTCDTCGGRLPAELDFYDAVGAKKRSSWLSRKVDGEWEDACCDCQEMKKDEDI